MASLISIGVTGLTSNQLALGTTGNNITNANVAGYSRQRVDLVGAPELLLGPGYMGSGVQVQGVTRIVEQFTISQLRLDTANFQGIQAQYTQASQMDSLLADQSTGLAPSLQALFADIQQASQDPTAIAGRQVALNDASSLAQRFNALYSQFQQQAASINQQLGLQTNQVSSFAQAIAGLNESISEATGGGAQPNALIDKRDELIRQMSELVGVNAVPQGNGTINIFVGNGQPLVVGAKANTLSVAASTTDPSRDEVVFNSGGNSQPISQFVSGGTIGGLLKFRQGTLDTAFNTLGQIALNVADTFNRQQQLGLDLNGSFGSNLFTDINLASEMQARVSPASANSSFPALGVRIDDPSKLTTSDYKLVFTSTTAYTLLHADGTPLSTPVSGSVGALPAAITTNEGFQIEIPASGTFAAGDSFDIQPTKRGALSIAVALQKPEELAFALPISTAANLNNRGGGSVSAGQMLAVYQADGVTKQTAFATPGKLTPPILIRFTSATTYDILDNSNPASPSVLQAALTFKPGQSNAVAINGDNIATGAKASSVAVAAPALSYNNVTLGAASQTTGTATITNLVIAGGAGTDDTLTFGGGAIAGSVSITLTPGPYADADALITEINAQISSNPALNGKLVAVSTGAGPGQSVNFVELPQSGAYSGNDLNIAGNSAVANVVGTGTAGTGAVAAVVINTSAQTFTVDFNGSGAKNITLATDYTVGSTVSNATAFASLINDVQSQLNTQFGPGKLLAQDDGTGKLQIVEAGQVFTGSTIAIGGPGENAVFGGNAIETTGTPTQLGSQIYTFDIYGSPATGDQFTVAYNALGSSDNRNALAMGGLQQTASIGRSTFEDVYAQLVSKVGSNTAQLKINSQAAESILTQAQNARDAVSGVNLDEEAANLIKFQQAYNASAQVISIARSIFDSLIAAFR